MDDNIPITHFGLRLFITVFKSVTVKIVATAEVNNTGFSVDYDHNILGS